MKRNSYWTKVIFTIHILVFVVRAENCQDLYRQCSNLCEVRNQNVEDTNCRAFCDEDDKRCQCESNCEEDNFCVLQCYYDTTEKNVCDMSSEICRGICKRRRRGDQEECFKRCENAKIKCRCNEDCKYFPGCIEICDTNSSDRIQQEEDSKFIPDGDD